MEVLQSMVAVGERSKLPAGRSSRNDAVHPLAMQAREPCRAPRHWSSGGDSAAVSCRAALASLRSSFRFGRRAPGSVYPEQSGSTRGLRRDRAYRPMPYG